MTRLAVTALLGSAILGGGCTPAATPTRLPVGLHSPYTGYSSAKYRDDDLWLCRPDLPGNRCSANLTATEIHPDGSRSIAPHVPARDPAVDCFYVYPTVDLSLFPANHTDFDDVRPMLRTTLAQAARFSEVCAVYVPLYRQVTIGTYGLSAGRLNRFLDVAFSDVLDAFLHYLGQYNHGRKVVLIGHSQGAEMVTRLVNKVFEGNPAMRARLLVAMPIGGTIEVPKGATAGGTFATIPACTRPDELGCVVGYRSHRAGSDPASWGWDRTADREMLCVNPADVAGNQRRSFSRAYFPNDPGVHRFLHGLEGVDTPYVLFRDFYAGRCEQGRDGYDYLAVSTAGAPGDRRVAPFDLGSFVLSGRLGLHILDLQIPQGDLIDLVARKIAAVPAGPAAQVTEPPGAASTTAPSSPP